MVDRFDESEVDGDGGGEKLDVPEEDEGSERDEEAEATVGEGALYADEEGRGEERMGWE